MRGRTKLCALGLGCLVSAVTSGAEAFSTRLHIMLANDVAEALAASGDATVPLVASSFSVELDVADVDAIVNHPLEFRAGAVGPDNTAFPGMTDPSHAIEQRPFEQCELLYQAAIVGEERAYALGCFLHGSTDAIAHHYVNYMTGETFTLTPLSAARETSLDNVVRHIVAEGMVQEAAFTARPSAFDAAHLEHRIPIGFVLRAYFDMQSPLWLRMAERAEAEFSSVKAANPGGNLVTWVTGADLAPADHLVLAPLYLKEADDTLGNIRTVLELGIAELQNPGTADGATLGVGPGPDGVLATSDDTTACTLTCPSLYASYRTYVSLLEPRLDAFGVPLPSAFDKITEKLSNDLLGFMPAYMQVVQNLSQKLNEPLAPGASQFSLDSSELAALFEPLDTWGANLTTLDFETLSQSVLPGWIISVQNALNLIGINIRVADLIAALFDPFIQPVKDAIKAFAVDQAKMFIGQLTDAISAQKDAIEAEFGNRLAASSSLAASPLERLFETGLYAHSFNIAAAAFANRRVVLPMGDHPVGIGPSSFDASHTPKWMQAGVCDYLREAIFPFGLQVGGLLTVRDSAGTEFAATITDDSPIECHDGSLTAFASMPTVDTCRLIDVEGLKLDPAVRGSLSRSHPPDFDDTTVECQGTLVPGLPEPPVGAGGAGGAAGSGSGGSLASGGANGAGMAGVGSGGEGNNGVGPTSGAGGGCGCRAVGGEPGSGGALLAIMGVAFAVSRRYDQRKAGASAA